MSTYRRTREPRPEVILDLVNSAKTTANERPPDMGRRRRLVIGLIMLIGGVAVDAIGAIYPFADPLVALGYLLFVPILVSICGTVFVFVSLARSTRKAIRSASVYRTARVAAVAGLGLALGYAEAALLSQVPDSLAGLNGPFAPSTAPAIQVLVMGGIGLLMGLLIGAVAARVWRAFRGRHLPPRSAESR
jgi:hypothetical protein